MIALFSLAFPLTIMQIKELGHVVLYVKDVNRSIAFYRDILGFRMIASEPRIALFSSGRTHRIAAYRNRAGTAGEEIL